MKKTFILNGENVTVENIRLYKDEAHIVLNGRTYIVPNSGELFAGTRPNQGRYQITLSGEDIFLELPRSGGKPRSRALMHTAPMPGTVQKVFVEPGVAVKAGQKLLVMEAMKLQIAIEAAYAGIVKELYCQPGGLVQEGMLLMNIEAK